MGPAIAHVFLSFGFGDEHVAVSIEARKERDEGYSSVQGFFKRYELIYVVGDERDLIRVRTNYRRDPPEDVYLYRVRAPIENIRRLFLEYVRAINELAERPRFYDTLTTNCTTTIRAAHARQSGAPAAQLEGPSERSRRRVRLRARPARHERAVRGAPAAVPHQRRGAGGGWGARLLAAHPRRVAGRAASGS